MFETLWILIGTIAGLVALGLVASFSPTLYALTAAVSQSKQPVELLRSKLYGIVVGILFLAALFQFFHPDALVNVFNSTVTALVISTWFHILIGGIFIASGILRLQSPVIREATTPPRPQAARGRWATASFGFIKTSFKLSAVASVFVATRIIFEASPLAIGRLILFCVFIAAALAPFVGLFFLFRRSPRLIVRARAHFSRIRRWLGSSRILAYTSVFAGAALIIFSVLESLRVG